MENSLINTVINDKLRDNNTVIDKFPTPIDESAFVTYNTRSFLYGETLNDYCKFIIFEVMRHYANKNLSSDNDQKDKIMKYINKQFKNNNLTFDRLKEGFGASTIECFMVYFLIAYKESSYDLILKAMYTFTRVSPMKYETDWLDNYRLNNYGNVLNMLMWKKYDKPYVYTIEEDPLSINTSIELDYERVVKYLVGSLRAFIIDYNLYDHFTSGERSIPKRRSYSAKEICDLCYKYYPFYYGGAHGCDCFNPSLGFGLSVKEISLFLQRYPSAKVGYILNTATYASGKGEHWMAMYITRNKAYLLCSQGSNFHSFHDPTLVNELSNNKFGTEYNERSIQIDNCNCGLYSFLSLYAMLCTGNNISNAIDMIGKNAENIIKGGIDTFRDRMTGATH